METNLANTGTTAPIGQSAVTPGNIAVTYWYIISSTWINPNADNTNQSLF